MTTIKTISGAQFKQEFGELAKIIKDDDRDALERLQATADHLRALQSID